MAILNYTTGIDSAKTIGEITKMLVRAGATKMVTDYTGELPTAVTFAIPIRGQLIGFSLPCNYAGVLLSMQRDSKVPRRLCTEEQALKVSWRIIKDWVEAQLAIVEAQLAELGEVFLPYAITKGGNTLYKEIQGSGMLMLQQ